MGKGWRKDSYRHGLASRGIATTDGSGFGLVPVDWGPWARFDNLDDIFKHMDKMIDDYSPSDSPEKVFKLAEDLELLSRNMAWHGMEGLSADVGKLSEHFFAIGMGHQAREDVEEVRERIRRQLQ